MCIPVYTQLKMWICVYDRVWWHQLKVVLLGIETSLHSEWMLVNSCSSRFLWRDTWANSVHPKPPSYCLFERLLNYIKQSERAGQWSRREDVPALVLSPGRHCENTGESIREKRRPALWLSLVPARNWKERRPLFGQATSGSNGSWLEAQPARSTAPYTTSKITAIGSGGIACGNK